jgi:hypothetical protein
LMRQHSQKMACRTTNMVSQIEVCAIHGIQFTLMNYL